MEDLSIGTYDSLHRLLESIENCIRNSTNPTPFILELNQIPPYKLKREDIHRKCSHILLNLIYHARSLSEPSQIPTYCLNILNRMDFCFSTKSLSRISARGSNLKKSTLTNCSFLFSDFRDSNFQDSCLINTNLTNCNLLNTFISDDFATSYKEDTINCVCISSNSSLIGCSNSSLDRKKHSVKIWDIEKGTLEHVIGDLERSISCLVFYKDDRQILLGNSDGKIEFWDLSRNQKEKEVYIKANYVMALDSNPSYSLLGASGCNFVICVWKDEELIHEFFSDYSLVTCIILHS